MSNTFEELEQLEENWDGCGAKKINKDIINKAKNIVEQLIRKPDIFPTYDGDIRLEYRIDKYEHIEFVIGSSDDIEFFSCVEGVCMFEPISKTNQIKTMNTYIEQFFDNADTEMKGTISLSLYQYDIPERICQFCTHECNSKEDFEQLGLDVNNQYLENCKMPMASINLTKQYIIYNKLIRMLPYSQAICMFMHEIGHTKQLRITSKQLETRIDNVITEQVSVCPDSSLYNTSKIFLEISADLYAINICGYRAYMKLMNSIVELSQSFGELNVHTRRNILKELKNIDFTYLEFVDRTKLSILGTQSMLKLIRNLDKKFYNSK